jgi:hypothetical protein
LDLKSATLAEKDKKIERLCSELEGRNVQLELKDDTIKTLNEEAKLSEAKFVKLSKQYADLNQSLTRCQEMLDQNT